MTKELDELEQKISLAEDNIRMEKENIRMKKENKTLQNRVNKLENVILNRPSKFERVGERIKDGCSSIGDYISDYGRTGALVPIYGAELYFLGTKFHDYMLSKANDWFIKNPGIFIEHIIGNGAIGAFLGLCTGAAIGSVVSYTYNLVKEKKLAPIEATATTAVIMGVCAAAGGLIGAEFTDPNGIVIGSYVGSAVGLGVTIENNSFVE